MKKTAIIALIISICSVLTALPISFNQQEISFGSCLTSTPITKTLKIYSQSDSDQQVTVLHTNPSFTFSDTLFTLAPFDSTNINIVFNGNQNINYNDVAFFTNGNENPSYIQMSAIPHYSEAIYNSTANLWDTQLKTALKTIVYNHQTLGYSSARQHMFGSIDNVNGGVECVYTGVIVQTSGIPDSDIMNCEHTWPQSKFSSADESKEVCDINHLYPTNSQANSIRGNYPFGIVTNSSWSVGGSKKGTNAQGVTVFEPRDQHKGDCARSMFYFAVCYNNPSSPFFNDQEAVLRQWHVQDPVSTKEINRNNGIEDAQGNRNPFVDHPELVDRIYSLSTTANRPSQAIYYSSDTTMRFMTTGQVFVPFTNIGNANMTISGVTVNNTNITIQNFTSSVQSGKLGLVTMNLAPSDLPVSAVLQITTNVGVKNITILYSGVSNSDIQNVIKPQLTSSIYPNPFSLNSTLVIESVNKLNTNVTIKFFNIKGQLVNEKRIQPNFQNVMTLKLNNKDINGNDLTSGIYFYQIQQSGLKSFGKYMIIR